MKDQYNHKYDDIINLPHPTSKKHTRMSVSYTHLTLPTNSRV